MFAFTRQEQKFLLIIVLAFFVGLTVKYVRQRSANNQSDDAWGAERDRVLKEFQQAAVQDETPIAVAQQTKPAPVSKPAITGNVNINSATLEELQLLPRIGPATAKKIIDYRTQHGPFKRKADIQNVKSIGPKTFEKIENYIIID